MGKMTDALRKARLQKEKKDGDETATEEKPAPIKRALEKQEALDRAKEPLSPPIAEKPAPASTPPESAPDAALPPPPETTTDVPPPPEPEAAEDAATATILPDVESTTEEAPVDELDREVYLAACSDREGPAAEAFRTLRTSLVKEAPSARVIVVTSCAPGEGKTMLAVNLAGSFAGAVEEKVLLVDANLFRPRLGDILDGGSEGLIQVTSGSVPVERAPIKTAIPGLWVVPLGERSGRSEGLLESKAVLALLKTMKKRFTRVIVELPAWSDLPHSPGLLEQADVVLVPVRPRRTSRPTLRRLCSEVRQAGAEDVLCVFEEF